MVKFLRTAVSQLVYKLNQVQPNILRPVNLFQNYWNLTIIIKAAREVEPNISKISKDLLARFYGGDDEELLDRITAPFY